MAVTATAAISYGALAFQYAVPVINSAIAGYSLTALGSALVVGGVAAGGAYLAYQGQQEAKEEIRELESKVKGLTAGGYSVNVKGSALHRQVIYGKTKVGGVTVFDHAHGTDNKYLSRIVAYAAHEVDDFEDIYIDDYKVMSLGTDGSVTLAQRVDEKGNLISGQTTTKFDGFIKIRKVDGGHTASLDGQSLSIDGQSFGGGKWTSSHILKDIAHLAVMFKFDRPEQEGDVERYENGLPTVTSVVRGKKVYDPRTTNTVWSDNPALIIRDYLTNDDYGLGEDSANIDDTRIATAANICDEAVSTDSSTRYTCNGAWLTSKVPADLLNIFTNTCAGTLWYAQGEWRLRAGKYTAPTISLSEDDLRSSMSVSTRHSRRDNFNGVRGIFKGPKSNYQPTDYPLVTSQTFIDVDGGLESVLDYPLPFTDTPGEAQRLANITLERNRSQLTLSGDFGLKAFELQVGDFVSFSNTRLGFSNKVFEVVNWGFGLADGQDLITNLTLRETSSTTFDEIQDTDFESDNTSLPGVLGPAFLPGSGDVSSTTDVTGLTASGGVREIYVNWTNPINDDFSYTKIYYDTNSSISGASQQNVTGESFVLSGLSANDTRYFWAQAYDSSNNTLGSQVGPISASVKDIVTNDIEDSAVVTDKIADNAVTDTISYDDSDITRDYDYQQSFTMDSAGEVVILAYVFISGSYTSGSTTAFTRLRINGTSVLTESSSGASQVLGGRFMVGQANVSSGSNNFKVEVDITGLDTTASTPAVNVEVVVLRNYK